MFKRIRDFIYDINDIFVALIILALAAGVIYWRSANIVEYPKYLSEKNHANASSELDFSDIDLEPEPVDTDLNYDPVNQGSLVDPDDPPAENTVDPTDVPVPGGENTADNTNNANNTNNSANTNEADNSNTAENTNTADNEGNTANNAGNEGPETIEFTVPINPSWIVLADELGELGLIENTDTAKWEFVNTASRLGYDIRLQSGTYELHVGMTQQEILETICKIR